MIREISEDATPLLSFHGIADVTRKALRMI